MLSSIKRFIRQVTLGENGRLGFAEDDHRLAAAALLVHVIAVDGIVDDEERVALKKVLRSAYSLTEEAADELIREAHQRDNEAVDLYGFTSVLKRKLPIEERLKVVEMMWELVYADGTVHEFEDNTIWRVAELLGVSSRDRLSLRRKVARGHDDEALPEGDDED
ncbi:TerB family tellurite resistance protein [Stappia sp. F7233]|uniref:TerB family tellurite resistance protein n=1 Tax=Stappia albiluteola TaxID=2758565 RepID=A0A839AHX4_9HYPH|nr:TerB family tellurite resistance protein [Stappia albiluteola]MBA5778676.1 TerB family tellurite resistance protein [Stappia albiluteola]